MDVGGGPEEEKAGAPLERDHQGSSAQGGSDFAEPGDYEAIEAPDNAFSDVDKLARLGLSPSETAWFLKSRRQLDLLSTAYTHIKGLDYTGEGDLSFKPYGSKPAGLMAHKVLCIKERGAKVRIATVSPAAMV